LCARTNWPAPSPSCSLLIKPRVPPKKKFPQLELQIVQQWLAKKNKFFPFMIKFHTPPPLLAPPPFPLPLLFPLGLPLDAVDDERSVRNEKRFAMDRRLGGDAALLGDAASSREDDGETFANRDDDELAGDRTFPLADGDSVPRAEPNPRGAKRLTSCSTHFLRWASFGCCCRARLIVSIMLGLYVASFLQIAG